MKTSRFLLGISLVLPLGAGCSDEHLIVAAGPPSGAGGSGSDPGFEAGGALDSGGTGRGEPSPAGASSLGGTSAGGLGAAGAGESGGQRSITAGSTSAGGSGAMADAGDAGELGQGGEPTTPECGSVGCSCRGMAGTECAGDDCCASPLVPGGTFRERALESTFDATVSSFRLDRYEVTVGRYRQFLNAQASWFGAGNPVAGAGAHPNIPGSGWKEEWDYRLLTFAGLDPACPYGIAESRFGSWAAGNETLPINCVNWFYAFAFCTWDGGRLPTETEWRFASGGVTQTRYPWGDEPALTGIQDETAAYAVYAYLGDGSAPGDVSFEDLLPVGSRPLGVGPFGQQDLVGSMAEWVLDSFTRTYPTAAVTDYANLEAITIKSMRGGSWSDDPDLVASGASWAEYGTDRAVWGGFRCAREP